MKHSEGFLKLVNDAKSRIHEVTVAKTRERILSADVLQQMGYHCLFNGRRLESLARLRLRSGRVRVVI